MQNQQCLIIEIPLQEIIFSDDFTISVSLVVSKEGDTPSIEWAVATDSSVEFFNDSESAQEVMKRKCGELALSGYTIDSNEIYGNLKGSYTGATLKHNIGTIEQRVISPKDIIISDFNKSEPYLKKKHTLRLELDEGVGG